MNNIKRTKKMTIEERRQLIYQYTSQANDLNANKKYADEEKILLKVVRMSENVYRETFSSKDKKTVINSYIHISEYYDTIQHKKDIVLRWYQKIVGVLQQSCEKYSTNDEYHYLIEWYLKTMNLLIDLKEYRKIITMANNMKSKTIQLYKKTKTTEDLKMVILSKLYLANAHDCLKHYFISYIYYYDVTRIMTRIYNESYNEGMKQDLLSIYDYIIAITKKSFLKIFHKRWVMKKMMLQEEKHE